MTDSSGLKQPERAPGPPLIIRRGDPGYEGNDDAATTGRTQYPGAELGCPVPLNQRIGNPSANQVGGDHYRKYNIQPIEYVLANSMGYLPGCALKYITRYKDKGGAEDIRKAIHYLKLILEFEYGQV